MKASLLSFTYTTVLLFYTKEMLASKQKFVLKLFLCKCMPENIPELRFKIWKIMSDILWDSINESY